MKPDWSFANQRVLCVGPSGCGKTTLALSLLAGLTKAGARLFALDQKGELTIRLAGPSCSTPDEAAAVGADGQPVLLNPHFHWPGNTRAGLAFLAWSAWHSARASASEVVLFVDELQDFCGSARSDVPKALGYAVESGRGWKLHTVATAQSANLVNSRLRQQFNRVAAFRQSDSTATAPLFAWGFDPHDVSDLPPGAFLLLDRDTGAITPGRITWTRGRPAVRLERLRLP